jgi:hypothetical protein
MAWAAMPRLQKLEVAAEGNTVQLEWRVANEQPGTVYVVERSLNGSTWQACGRVAAENSAQPQRYSFENTIQKAYNYYRLRLKGRPGEAGVLATRFVNLQTAAVYFRATPRPQQGYVHLHYTLDRDVDLLLRVFDHVGQEVRTKLVPSGEAGVYDVRLPFESYRRGIYLLILTQVDRDLDLAEARIEY